MAYAQALLVNREQLEITQLENDAAGAQQILQQAFRTDVRPLLQEAMLRSGGALDPLGLVRELGVRRQLIRERGASPQATGLSPVNRQDRRGDVWGKSVSGGVHAGWGRILKK